MLYAEEEKEATDVRRGYSEMTTFPILCVGGCAGSG